MGRAGVPRIRIARFLPSQSVTAASTRHSRSSRPLWREHRTTFVGRHYRLENAPCEPKPLQQPFPPITIGGSGLGTLRLAARYATTWNMQGPPDKFAERAALLRRCCEEVGRDFDEIELSLHP